MGDPSREKLDLIPDVIWMTGFPKGWSEEKIQNVLRIGLPKVNIFNVKTLSIPGSCLEVQDAMVVLGCQDDEKVFWQMTVHDPLIKLKDEERQGDNQVSVRVVNHQFNQIGRQILLFQDDMRRFRSCWRPDEPEGHPHPHHSNGNVERVSENQPMKPPPSSTIEANQECSSVDANIENPFVPKMGGAPSVKVNAAAQCQGGYQPVYGVNNGLVVLQGGPLNNEFAQQQFPPSCGYLPHIPVFTVQQMPVPAVPSPRASFTGMDGGAAGFAFEQPTAHFNNQQDGPNQRGLCCNNVNASGAQEENATSPMPRSVSPLPYEYEDYQSRDEYENWDEDYVDEPPFLQHHQVHLEGDGDTRRLCMLLVKRLPFHLTSLDLISFLEYQFQPGCVWFCRLLNKVIKLARNGQIEKIRVPQGMGVILFKDKRTQDECLDATKPLRYVLEDGRSIPIEFAPLIGSLHGMSRREFNREEAVMRDCANYRRDIEDWRRHEIQKDQRELDGNSDKVRERKANGWIHVDKRDKSLDNFLDAQHWWLEKVAEYNPK